jgi:hypothetical protein
MREHELSSFLIVLIETAVPMTGLNTTDHAQATMASILGIISRSSKS